MKPHYINLLIGILFLVSSCVETKNQTQDSNNHKDQHELHDDSIMGQHTNSANKHMHKSSVDALIERFESPERDAYQQPDKVLEYLGNINNKTILDIGAGSGYFSVKLAANGANVIAADVDDEFLEFIENRIEKDSIKNIELRKIPYDSPSLADKEADMVLIVNTYHHIEDRVNYFSKVKKGLKDNGELIVIDFYKKELPVGPKPDHKISKAVVISELEQAGFMISDINVELLPYQYIIKAK